MTRRPSGFAVRPAIFATMRVLPPPTVTVRPASSRTRARTCAPTAAGSASPGGWRNASSMERPSTSAPHDRNAANTRLLAAT